MELGRHCVKSRSATQQVAALPTEGAELRGVAEGAGVLIGAISMMRDLGISANGVLCANSSAAKGVVSRRGLGRVKHVDVRNMWIQNVARSGRAAIVKIPGGENAADVLTKHLDVALKAGGTSWRNR